MRDIHLKLCKMGSISQRDVLERERDYLACFDQINFDEGHVSN
jgi:hypothetical protein